MRDALNEVEQLDPHWRPPDQLTGTDAAGQPSVADELKNSEEIVAAARVRVNEVQRQRADFPGEPPTNPRVDAKGGKPADLRNEEGIGGHGYSFHIARTDAQLAERAMKRAASDGPVSEGSFDSIEKANDYVDKVLGSRPDLVNGVASGKLDRAWIEMHFDEPTGREAYQADRNSPIIFRPTRDVGVLIQRFSDAAKGFRIRTAYPLNR